MKKRRIKKWPVIILILAILTITSLSVLKYKEEMQKKKVKEEKELIKEISSHYNQYVKTESKAKIYDKNEKVIGMLSNITLNLEKQKIDNLTN